MSRESPCGLLTAGSILMRKDIGPARQIGLLDRGDPFPQLEVVRTATRQIALKEPDDRLALFVRANPRIVRHYALGVTGQPLDRARAERTSRSSVTCLYKLLEAEK